jgi:hypothetical protein
MLNFGYHLARAEGSAARFTYRAALPAIVRCPISEKTSLSFNVFSYSGERNLPEQVASIRSFLRYVGRPKRFTIVSDGTLSDRSARVLKRLDPAISISGSADWVPKGLPARMYPYLTSHPTGKQLALIMSLPIEGPTLYLDSDVLFFPSATELVGLAESREVSAYYMADCKLSADERIFRSEAEQTRPVNTGVLFLFQKLDWALAIRRFLELEGAPEFFTNQTMTHLTMHANGALPFNDEKYVLQLDDQFVYSDRYMNRDLVLRHYVNPVRHKFWTTLTRRGFL